MSLYSESAGGVFRLPVVRLSASGKLRHREFHFSPKQRKATGAGLSYVAHSLKADDQTPRCSSCGTHSLVRVSASCQCGACSAPVKLEAEEQGADELEGNESEALVSRRFQRTGLWEFKPFVFTEFLEPTPEWDKSIVAFDADPFVPEGSGAAAFSPHMPAYVPYGFADAPRRGLWLSLGLGMVLVLMAVVAGVYVWSREPSSADGTSVVPDIVDFSARVNESAKLTLSGFLTAENAPSLAARVIDGETKLPEIKRYLAQNGALSKPGELDEISSIPISKDDLKRGIAGLIYQQDPPVDLMPMNPLIPLAAKTVGPLEQMAMASTLQGKKPRRALALFKRKGEQMLLEWDLFVQTWDRTLAAFRDGELGDGPMRFRVLVAADIPVSENGETLGSAVFRIQDPLHTEDIIRVQTKCFSSEERRLLEYDRTTPGMSARVGSSRTATLDLVRDPATGRIEISRFVCWEFLGIGGVERESPND